MVFAAPAVYHLGTIIVGFAGEVFKTRRIRNLSVCSEKSAGRTIFFLPHKPQERHKIAKPQNRSDKLQVLQTFQKQRDISQWIRIANTWLQRSPSRLYKLQTSTYLFYRRLQGRSPTPGKPYSQIIRLVCHNRYDVQNQHLCCQCRQQLD
jgi:hypothetical protein